MKNFILCLVLLSSISLSSYSSQYFFYYQDKQMVMTRNYEYIALKFKAGTTETEVDRIYNTIAPLAEKRLEHKTGKSLNIINRVLVIQLKSTVTQQAALDIEQNLKLNSSISYVGMSFVYNDKVLHFVTDEVIVKFKKNVSESSVGSLNRLYGTEILEKVSSFENTYLVKINTQGTDNSFDISNKYAITQLVDFAQPNFLRYGMLLGENPPTGHTDKKPGNGSDNNRLFPNDTLLPRMWNIKNTGSNIPNNIQGTPGCDMNMELAWDITTGNPNVLLAIIDTGIDTNHTDLRPNLCDRTLWYDAYDNDQKPYDEYYHGTGVSGTAIGVGNNIAGVAGIAFNCRVMPVRVFGPAPAAFTTDLILAKGLNWAWSHGAAVMNCSWGGGIPGPLITHAIQNAVNYGRSGKGSVVFGGAGNADTNVVIYPASMSEVIGVGGLSPCNQRKSKVSCDNIGGVQDWGACYGEGMEIVAPCTYIGTTELGGGWCICGNGTSVSSPLAAGVAALMISKNINLSGDSVKMIIEKYARKVGNYSYNVQKENGLWNEEMGYGTIDAKACLDNTPQGPTEIFDQVPPIVTIFPPESNRFSTPVSVEAIITDNSGIASGMNSPRLYYRTIQNNQIQSISGIAAGDSRYRFTFPLIPYTEGAFYWIAAQDIVPVPNFVTYPLGGSGVNPPGQNAPPKQMFFRNTDKYDTTFISTDVPITISSANETSFVSILNNPVAKTILDVNVMINCEHTFDADLTFSLISPQGTEIVLAGGVGWDGNNFTNTYFDDEADIAIDSSLAVPPFTGTFKPIDKLWLMDGENSFGQWKLRVVDNGRGDGGALLGWSVILKYSTEGDNVIIPGEFSLVKNYPNPFNPKTRIVFNVPRFAHIKIVIYDAAGREVKTVLNENRTPALQDFVDFDASQLASGVYFYNMIADDDFIDAKRMVLVK
jgi:subtilisin family serine protease/subtilisin-like proprotein convertase family protein